MAIDIASVGFSLVGNVINVLIAIVGIVIVLGVGLGVFFYTRHIKKYNIIVEIRSERSGLPDIGTESVEAYATKVRSMTQNNNYKIIYDKGAMLYSKDDKNWYFRIKGEKVDLPVPPFNVLTASNKGNVLKVWQRSKEEYFYLLSDKIDPTVIRAHGGTYNVAQLSTKVVDSDISFWNVKKKEKVKKLFDPESILAKVLAYIPQIVSGFLTIMLLWIVFDKLPGLITKMTELATAINSNTGGQAIVATTQ